jgi:transposase
MAHLLRSGLNVQFSGLDMLTPFLSYKAAQAGVPLHTVDPRNTSRTCSVCGYCAKENRKSQASFVCQTCGYTDNADRNAALNISRAVVMQPMVAPESQRNNRRFG